MKKSDEIDATIAEFMGYEKHMARSAYEYPMGGFKEWSEPSEVWVKNPTPAFLEHKITDFPNEVGLEFDEKLFDEYMYPNYSQDWNSLMAAVEKIESLSHHNREDFGYVVTIEPGYVVISDNGEAPIVEAQFDGPKIDLVCDCVARFIEWHKTAGE